MEKDASRSDSVLSHHGSDPFRLLVESVRNCAIFMIDTSGAIISWNTSAERLLGYTAGEVLSQHIRFFYTPEDIQAGKPEDELNLALAHGRHESESLRVRKDGSKFRTGVTTAALYDFTRKHVGFARVLHDITDLREAEDLFRLVLQFSIDGVIGISEKGFIRFFNQAAEELFGYARSEVIGQNVSILMPEPYRSQHDGYIDTYLRTGNPKAIGRVREVVGQRKDGSTFPVEMSINEFFAGERRYFAGVVRDITERKRLEEQFYRSQKMEAIGQLAGGVAHDFNNLLTVIMGYSDILMATMPADHVMREPLAEIRQAGEQAANLTRQLLAFSRQTVIEPRLVDLNETVLQTEKMLRRLIGEDITLKSDLGKDVPLIKVDPGQMQQLLMNLSINARDAMPQGGDLIISTRRVAMSQSDHPEARPGNHVLLSIADTGCGMAPEIQKRIFEPFFTTKPQGKGTGLGLSVVHGIVRQSAGRIEVDSEMGRGATFKIYFPAVGEASARNTEQQVASRPEQGGETIVLVEDEAPVRELEKLLLEDMGYIVLIALSPQEAIDLIDSRKETIDLLMTDVVMPQMSGRTLAETIKSRHPSLKALFVSGYTDDEVMRHGLQHDKVVFLQKPFSPETLAAKFREALDSVSS